MHCDPAINPALAYIVCNDEDPGGRTFTTTDADGYTISLRPGSCCFISAIIYCSLRLENVPWLSAEDVCQAEFEAGCTVGGVCIPPSVIGVSASGTVFTGAGAGGGAGAGLFNHLIHLAAFTDGTPGPARVYQATYVNDSLLAINFVDPAKGAFTAEHVEIDNLNGAVDIFVSYDGANDAILVRAGSVETLSDSAGLIASVYVRTAAGTSALNDVYIQAYRNI